MNPKVGRVTPCAPFIRLSKPGAHGVTRPTLTNPFTGSGCEAHIRVIPFSRMRAGVIVAVGHDPSKDFNLA